MSDFAPVVKEQNLTRVVVNCYAFVLKNRTTLLSYI